VVTVQRAIEMAGIPTVLVTLDPHQSGLMRPSRAIHPAGFEFGHSLGQPGAVAVQTAVLQAAFSRLMARGEPGLIEEVEIPGYVGWCS